MARRRMALAILALATLLLASGPACHAGPAGDPTVAAQEGELVELPGVETRDLTPRERRELARYVTTLAAPCPDVAVPVGQCVREKRACRGCVPAAAAIARAVREGMAAEQIQAMYRERFDPASSKAIPVDGSPARGPDAAQVTIVEFADFECPFCQRLAPEIDLLVGKRPDKVRFVYKFMPLSMHPRGEPAARAAIAAQAQGKFWEMHHQLFASGGHLEDGDLEGYAKAIGLDLARFRADVQAPATKARLDADRKLADDLGVKGTPTIYINGREYDAKVNIDEWVDSEIARASR
jgi:protein-disulfide isomerase